MDAFGLLGCLLAISGDFLWVSFCLALFNLGDVYKWRWPCRISFEDLAKHVRAVQGEAESLPA